MLAQSCISSAPSADAPFFASTRRRLHTVRISLSSLLLHIIFYEILFHRHQALNLLSSACLIFRAYLCHKSNIFNSPSGNK